MVKSFTNKIIPNKGIQYVLISVLAFSIMQTLVKYLTAYSPFQHIFIRSVIGWFVCYYFLKKRGIPLRGKNQKYLILRGLIGGINMFGFFFILTRIPFASSIALKYLSPIFATIFSVLFLKEKVKPILWLCFIISVVGVLMIKGGDNRIGTLDLVIGIGSSVFGGLLYIVIRKIGDDDNHLVILHYYMLITGFFSLIFSLSNWVSPNLKDGILFIVIGLVGFTAQNYFTKSIQVADDVSLIANMRYIEAALAVVIGYYFFDEKYSFISYLGLGLIFFGLIAAIWLKKYKY